MKLDGGFKWAYLWRMGGNRRSKEDLKLMVLRVDLVSRGFEEYR